MILLIDNYDSFVHNLARYFKLLGQETRTVRNDVVDVAAVREMQPRAIVISPGPCTPAEAGCSVEIVTEFAARTPMLGVCLGHQAVAAAFGAQVVRAQQPMHGRTSSIDHQRTGLFSGLPSPLTVCRYHSLVVEPTSLPSELEVTARSDDGCSMAIEHARWPVFGVQFHPEAILSECGFMMLANFLQAAGCDVSVDARELAANELRPTLQKSPSIPSQPITF